MEPPAKRLKAGQAPCDDLHNEANDDELSLPLEEFEARQDPLYELDKSRAKAVFKLKSRFESIFDKYEKDFEGVSDEINLHTGEVIIDNGHLLSLEDEQDKSDLSADEEEEDRILQDQNPPSTSTPLTSGQSTPYNAALLHRSNWAYPPAPPNHGLPSFSGLSTPAQYGGVPHPFAAFGSAPVDPMWQTPELQMGGPQGHLGLFANSYLGHSNPYSSGYGGGIGRLLNRRIPRRIATAKELAMRNRQDAFLGEELAEEEENDGSQDHEDGGEDEDGRPEQEPSNPSKEKPQEPISVPSTSIPKEHLTKNDSTVKTGVTTTDIVLSGSHGLSGVSDQIQVEGTTSVEAQVEQEEHHAPENKTTQPTNTAKKEQIPKQNSFIVIELQSTPGGILPQKQLTTKKIRREKTLQEEDIAGGSQSRRPGRPRTKPECCGNVSWLKTKRGKPDLETVLDSGPNEEDSARLEESDNQTDTDMAMADASIDTNFIIEQAPVDELEELQPGDVGNNEFIEAAESIFLSRMNCGTDSADGAHEPTLNRSPGLYSQAMAGSEPVKPTQRTESFSRNQIDPSYNFSDDEDEAEARESSKPPRVAEPGPRKISEPEGEGEGLALPNCTGEIATTEVGEESTIVSTNQDEETLPVESPSKTTTVEALEFSNIPLSEAKIGKTTSATSQEVGEEGARATSPEIPVDQIANADDRVNRRPSSPEEEEQQQDFPGPTGSSEVRQGSRPSPSPSRTLANPRQGLVDDSATPRTPTTMRKRLSLNDDGRGSKKRKPLGTTETNRLTSSAKKHALASLIPDNSDDEDEISILAHTPTSSRRAEEPPPSSSPSPSSPLARNTVEPFTPHRSSHRTGNRSNLGSAAAAAVRSGSRRSLGGGRSSSSSSSSSSARQRRSGESNRSATKTKTAFSSPLLQRVLKTPRTGRRYYHPSSIEATAAAEEEGLVRTPGGTMRRCGVDGFVCDRDFCLTCCQ